MLNLTELIGFGTGGEGLPKVWRIVVNSGTGSGSGYGFAEIEMAETVGGADLCSGGVSSASSQYSTAGPAQAFDNDSFTDWINNGHSAGGWIQYAFPEPVILKSIRVRSPYSIVGSPVTGLSVYSSEDGVTFKHVTTVSGLPSSNNTWSTINF